MAFGRSETWFWRVVGVFALSVCSLNVMVLYRGPTRIIDNQQYIYSNLQRTDVTVSTGVVNAGQAQKDLVATAGNSKEVNPNNKVLPMQVIGDLKKKPTNEEISASVKIIPYIGLHDISNQLDRKKIITFGKIRKEKAFLTIGLPTAKRMKAFYLPDTVRGLVNGLSKEEMSEVVIVVFVADFDTGYQDTVKKSMKDLFPAEIESGLIHVVVPSVQFYPSFHNIPLLFHDSVARVHWRSKQALDYSFLYFHCADLGQYFLQLEDDVLTEKNYLKNIKKFINSRKTPWSTLEFGARGFIGMMYNSSSLIPLARYCRLNFFLMPVDWLFRVFNDIWLHGNSKENIRKPPLFKHIGAFSTLDGQVRKLEDVKKGPALPEISKFYKDTDNPAASLETTIVDTNHVANYPLRNAYGEGSFWAKNIKVGDTITITFQNPINLNRVAFISGTPAFPLDSLEDGEVLVSTETTTPCHFFMSINKFKSMPIVDIKNIRVRDPVKCIKLQLETVRLDDHGRHRWLIIREISVWIKK